jgi:hypothetical protein
MGAIVLTYPSPIEAQSPVEGKFLQLRWAQGDYLLFSAAAELRYHNQILGRFLSEQGIPHHWEDDERLVFAHPELEVVGGGRFRLDLVDRTLQVWDTSGVYGRFDVAALSAQLAAAGGPWEGLALSVG